MREAQQTPGQNVPHFAVFSGIWRTFGSTETEISEQLYL
jgi:hypothetical protein